MNIYDVFAVDERERNFVTLGVFFHHQLVPEWQRIRSHDQMGFAASDGATRSVEIAHRNEARAQIPSRELTLLDELSGKTKEQYRGQRLQ